MTVPSPSATHFEPKIPGGGDPMVVLRLVVRAAMLQGQWPQSSRVIDSQGEGQMWGAMAWTRGHGSGRRGNDPKGRDYRGTGWWCWGEGVLAQWGGRGGKIVDRRTQSMLLAF